MKTPRSFSRNRFSSGVRFTIAGTLLCAAVAMAFVAAKPSGPFLLGKSGNTNKAINKFRQDRDQTGGNRRTMPGPEIDRGPITAAQERYANRAYPASDVPFRLTRNAQRAWANVLSMSQPSANPWTLIGLSTANFPDILTFSGRDYTTSGRITALAIAPTCTTATAHFGLEPLAAVSGARTTRSQTRQTGHSSRAALRPMRSGR